MPSLSYNQFNGGAAPGPCPIIADNNAQFLFTINKNTALVTSEVKSVTYNGTTESDSGTLLSELFYKEHVIEFTSFSQSNTVTFNLGDLPIHQKIIIRARVYTQCSDSQNQTIQMSIGGTPITSLTLVQSTPSILEGEATHTGATVTLKFQFGTASQNCRKIIQDISVYFEKCQTFCGSNLCPDDLPYFKLLGVG